MEDICENGIAFKSIIKSHKFGWAEMKKFFGLLIGWMLMGKDVLDENGSRQRLTSMKSSEFIGMTEVRDQFFFR